MFDDSNWLELKPVTLHSKRFYCTVTSLHCTLIFALPVSNDKL